MTDKEQIIINGVDVSGCEFLTKTVHCKAQMSIMGTDTNKCRCFPNCYYKQLQRRIAECEELKAYAQAQENQRETYYKEFLKLSQENKELKRKVELMMDCPDCKVDEYKKALKGIEEYCENQISITGDLPFRTTASDILDIIDRFKKGE